MVALESPLGGPHRFARNARGWHEPKWGIGSPAGNIKSLWPFIRVSERKPTL